MRVSAVVSTDEIPIKACHPEKYLVDVCNAYDGYCVCVKNVFNSGVGLRYLISEFLCELAITSHSCNQGINRCKAKDSTRIFKRM